MNLGKYGKAVVAGAGALAIVAADNYLNTNDVINVVLAVLTAVGVYLTPHKE